MLSLVSSVDSWGLGREASGMTVRLTVWNCWHGWSETGSAEASGLGNFMEALRWAPG